MDNKFDVDNFISDIESKLDTTCPTNISLVKLGKIIKDVNLNFPAHVSNFVWLKQKYVRFSALNILKSKNFKEFKYWINFLSLIILVQLFKKDIKFCNIERLQLAIASAKHNHLFKNGIQNGLEKLVDAIVRRWYNRVDMNSIHKLLYEIRHRISQSVKSIARNYMKVNIVGSSKSCDIIAKSMSNQILMYGLEVHGKVYDMRLFGADNTENLLNYLCRKSESSIVLLAALFKVFNVTDIKEKRSITKALKELVT